MAQMQARRKQFLAAIGLAMAAAAGGLWVWHVTRCGDGPPSVVVGEAVPEAATPRDAVESVARDLAAAEPSGDVPAARTPAAKSPGAWAGPSRPVSREASAPASVPASSADRSAMVSQRWTRMRSEVKYRLPGTYVVQQLDRSDDAELRLTDDQREAVDRIDEGMKAAIEATLGPVWSQREDVRVRLRAAIVEKNQGAVEMLRGEYARLYGEESRLRREQLNERYKSLLAEVLTEAQMKLFSEEARTVGDTRKLYGPRQVTSQSIQYQTAGD
ncbi:MAG TPA: hypothetical protein PLP01_05070 [Phycisphaerae bacterium]|nr:hypothetical protein [Phycisphaerae bacterium]HOI54596.1 hypothetical protein [Phycisphaerae bacterium]